MISLEKTYTCAGLHILAISRCIIDTRSVNGTDFFNQMNAIE